MTKRDDDSQTDMEVGMTTAERRRRRRRGGLRVPSDNVPRRTSTPPVAPVPEEPGLAMSIAYSFTEAQDTIPRAGQGGAVPSFEHHEGMPTVIDPVSGPVEQTDFEMKTREMTAVDLEELGLDEPGASGITLPIQRVSSPSLEPAATRSPAAAVEVRFAKREAIDPSDDVEVDLDASIDGVVDGGVTLDQEPGRGDGLAAEVELDGAEPTMIHPGPPVPADLVRAAAEAPPPRPVASESSQPHPRPMVQAMPLMPAMPAMPVTPGTPVMPVATGLPMAPGGPGGPGGSDASPRPVAAELSPRPAMTPVLIPPLAPPAGGYRIARAQTVALSEDDLEEVREATRLATQPSGHPPGHPPARPMSTSIPPPMPLARQTGSRPIEPPPSSPELDIEALDDKAEASGEFEVDVEGIEAKVDEPLPVLEPPPPPLDPWSRPSVAPARESQSMAVPREAHAPPPPPPSVAPARESQSMAVPREAHAPPPPPSVVPARESQSMAVPREAHAPPPPPSVVPARESQSAALPRDVHTPPPPPPSSAMHRAPPSPPPRKEKSSPGLSPPLPKPDVRDELRELREMREPRDTRDPREARDTRDTRDGRLDGKGLRGKPWFIDLFDEDYLRTLPFLTPQATQAEAEFVIDAMGLTPGAQVLDVGCGYGRHAMELAARGFHVVGFDLSMPLLVRGGEEAHRRGLTINFVRGDMRELDFDAQFEGAYCLFSTFGYFDDETNKKTIANLARALRPGGRVLVEILNRDYVIADLPTRVWWEGDGCVVLEEVELNYFSSRIQVNRSVVFDDGRQLEQEISVRAYSLHEVGKLMHSAGLRVLEVSGAYHTRGRFFGNQSRHIIVLAERKDPSAT